MYKVAVFSDIHGNLEVLKAILNNIGNYDEKIFLGDLIDLGPSSNECVKLMLKSDVRWILGNHDLYYLRGLDNFNIEDYKVNHYKYVHSTLDDYKKEISNNDLLYVIERNGHKLLFSHYFMKDVDAIYPFYSIGEIKHMSINEILKLNDCDYYFYGHDHKPSMYKFNDKYLIDVGSSGCVYNDKTFYTSIIFDKDIKIAIKEISFDRKKLEEDFMNSNMPNVKEMKESYFGIVDTEIK